jgi:hypothetical protein
MIKTLLLSLLLSSAAFAQTFPTLKVGDSAPIATSAALEVKSTTKALLIPRMTTTQKNAIASPANGELVYDTTLGSFSGYQGGAWSSLGGITLGTFDGQSATANGLAFTSGTLYAQSADATHPGMVNTTTQTFGGTKTFSNVNSSGVYQIGGSSVFSIPTTGNTYLGLSDGTSGTGNYNTGVGYNSLSDPSFTGGLNTAIGAQSLQHATTASQNVSIGVNTCTFNTGTSNTCIGYGSNVADGLIGAMSIGSNAVANASGAIILGDSNTKTGLANVNSGVPTARLHLPAGTATAGSAPLKITSGTNLTSAEAGAIENNGTNLFYTQDSGPTRKTLAFTSDIPAAGITALTGDVTASGSGSVAATLATVNSNVGSFGSSTAIPSFTVNGKGLLTAASTNAVVAPAGTLTGTTLASNVVTSSLTTVGTIGAGVWNGTAIATSFGGTGQTTANASLNALLPTQTSNALKYLQTDGTNTSWAVASGGTGINYIGLSTSWLLTGPNDVNAESTVGNWLAFKGTTLTGGSPTVTCLRTTTAGHVIDGTGSFEVVKDAADRSTEGCSVLVNVPLAYRTGGQNAQIQIPFQIFSGSITSTDLILAAYDVTNGAALAVSNSAVVGSSLLTGNVFIPATTAQLRIAFYFNSTAATAVTFDFDDVYLGPPNNIGSTSQAQFIGSINWAGTTSCQWDRTANNSFGNFAADTDCPTPTVKGFAAAPGTKIPAMATTGTIPAGEYLFVARGGFFTQNTNGICGFRISDGTNSTSTTEMYNSAGNVMGGTVTGHITYSTPQSAPTWNIQATGTNGNETCDIYNVNATDSLEIAVYRFPMSSEVAFRFDQVANSWAGHYGQNTWGRTNTAYGDFTATSATLTEDLNHNFGTVTNDGGTTLPDFTFTPSRIGTYWVCASSGMYGGLGTNIGVRLTDGTTVIDEKVASSLSNGDVSPFSLCGLYNATSTSPVTLKIQGYATSGSVTLSYNSTPTAAVLRWSIFQADQQFPAPLLTADDCEIWYTTGNGWGGSSSGETKVRNFSTSVRSVGTCMTRTARTTTAGDFITINRAGMYAWKYVDVNASGERFCVMYNWQSADRSTTCEDVATQYRIDLGTGASGGYLPLGGTKRFNVGDTIRAGGQGSSSSTIADIQFRLTWVGY